MGVFILSYYCTTLNLSHCSLGPYGVYTRRWEVRFLFFVLCRHSLLKFMPFVICRHSLIQFMDVGLYAHLTLYDFRNFGSLRRHKWLMICSITSAAQVLTLTVSSMIDVSTTFFEILTVVCLKTEVYPRPTMIADTSINV